jgi:hypothetical protein
MRRRVNQTKRARAIAVMAATTGGLIMLLGSGCKERVTQAQCDELLGKFAQLVVTEKLPTAPPEVIRTEQAREREEAARDDNFKNCTTELRKDEYRCAMSAPTAEALLKCLE